MNDLIATAAKQSGEWTPEGLVWLAEQKCIGEIMDTYKYTFADKGYYNWVIRGYLIRAMRNTHFDDDDIKRALRGLRYAFDDMTARQAEDEDI